MEGGGDLLSGECRRLLIAQALESGHEKELDRFPITNPVAWTKTYTGKSGIPARVFFTTLGHPYYFKLEPMRKLALGGIFWGAWRTKYPPMASRPIRWKPTSPTIRALGISSRPAAGLSQRPWRSYLLLREKVPRRGG